MSNNAPSKKEEITFCAKPSFNAQFNNVYSKQIRLTSNYFPLTLNKLKVFQYSIKITPEIANDNFPLRQLIYKNIHHKIKENNFSPFLSSGFVLYTCNKEAPEVLPITAEIKEIEYTILIEKTHNTIDLSLINNYSIENLCVKTFIETLIRKIIEANSNLIRFDKRTYFDYVNYKTLENSKIKIFPGYSTAVVITERGLNLRVLDANKLISGKTALDKINELRDKYKNGSIKENIIDYFKGRSLLTTYGSMRVYRIGDVSFDKNILNTEFQIKDESGNFNQINLKNYYKKFYSVDIRDPQQPLFIEEQKLNRDGTKKNNIVYLIPELLYLTDIEIDKNSLDSKRNMIMKTKLKPVDKMIKINDFFKLLNNNKQKIKKIKGIEKHFPSSFDVKNQWGLELSGNMEIFGKVIKPPDIHFDKNIIKIEEGKEKFRMSKIINPIPLKKNSWICITSKNNYRDAKTMCIKLIDSSKTYGIEIELPSIKEIDARYSRDFIDELNYLNLQNYKIIVFVLTKYTENFYNDIKNYVNLHLKKPCQCMRSFNCGKSLSYYGNVLIQMQNKLGSELFYINLDNQLINKKGVIMGIETSKYNGGNTYILTCSYLNYHNMYFIIKENIDYDINNQTNNLERGLFNLLRKCFDQLRKCNFEKPPNYIFVYRAGGNEKMIEKIKKEAIIFSKLLNSENGKNSLINKGKIMLNFTVCNRKTSSKFFEKSNKPEIKNPACGTVIDNNITSPNYYEFYLQPQFVNQGTANPVYFRVLYDDTHMPIEIFEKLTYHLTFLYTNWTGPIPYPVSLKYAEKALSFINKNLNGEVPDNNLSSTHFYI